MTGNSRLVDVNKFEDRRLNATADQVAIEEPLEIQLVSERVEGAAAKSISITMRTPGDDHNLALGFLYTEGVIESADQIVDVRHVGEADSESGLRNIVRVEIDATVDLQLDRLTRHFYTTSSCGVCGKASLEALAMSGLASLAEQKTAFSAQMLLDLPDRVRKLQPLFAETGGLHAAAIFGSDGEILVVKEDVGRHNATDKAIGALLSAGLLPGHRMGVLVSGRASFELMQKALVGGVPFLAAIGAPSSLAVQTAMEFDMTLIGFLRNGSFNVYANPHRIKGGDCSS